MSYIPNTQQQREAMLSFIGVDSAKELFSGIPKALTSELKLPPPLGEMDVLEELKQLASKNNSEWPTFLGAGSYNHFIPAVVKHICSRSEFYTAYTPYQAEASQGTLQAIFEYQSLICSLTGMDAANASMYDGATAMAEAAFLARAANGRKKFLVSYAVHPAYREVLKTYAGADELVTFDSALPPLTSEISCVIMAQPNFFGRIEPVDGLAEKIHANGSLFIVAVNPISLGLLKPPGEYGADVVVGEGQPLGNPQSFGGPGLGIFAVKEKYLRQMPGRLAGMTTDKNGKRGFCLTLQTREQHIRREKAGSNICSNEALCALAAAVYLGALGPSGLKQVATLCYNKAHDLASCLSAPSSNFFNEFVVKLNRPASEVNKILFENKIIGGLDLSKFYPELKNQMLLAVTEKTKKEEMDQLAEILKRYVVS